MARQFDRRCGLCVRCGEYVPNGEGVVTRHLGKYLPLHWECEAYGGPQPDVVSVMRRREATAYAGDPALEEN